MAEKLIPSTQAKSEIEDLIAECIPGGSVCDPQAVADNIRRYCNAWPDPEHAEARGDEPAAWQERQELSPGKFGEWHECKSGWSLDSPMEIESFGVKYQFRPLYTGSAQDNAHRLVQLVLDDMDTCIGECGSDYEFKELSAETVEALKQYTRPAPAAPQHEGPILSLLLEAGHVTQLQVDQARAIAAKTPGFAPAAPQAGEALRPGFAAVPMILTDAMERVTGEEGWTWAELLAAAQAITEEEYTLLSRLPGLLGDCESLASQPMSRDECAELERLRALVNTPTLHSFRDGVVLEAAHQRERWGSEHDAGKTPADWFWLVGYLAGKALHAHTSGDTEKALHHTISTAAALANWHASITGEHTAMRPGIDPAAHGVTSQGEAA